MRKHEFIREATQNEKDNAFDELSKWHAERANATPAYIWTVDDLKKAQQLVKIAGRSKRWWWKLSAGQIVDQITGWVRDSQAKAGQMPQFTGAAPTTVDFAKQVAIQTNGRYKYSTPVTWTTGRFSTKYREPKDYIVYNNEEDYEDAWEWLQGRGKLVYYKDSFGSLITAIKVGKYITEPGTIVRNAFSTNPETTYRLSVRTTSSLSSSTRQLQDITDQQASGLSDIAATKDANSMEQIKAIVAVVQGEQDLARIINQSQKITASDKAKLDAIIAGAANFKEPE